MQDIDVINEVDDQPSELEEPQMQNGKAEPKERNEIRIESEKESEADSHESKDEEI